MPSQGDQHSIREVAKDGHPKNARRKKLWWATESLWAKQPKGHSQDRGHQALDESAMVQEATWNIVPRNIT